MAVTTSKWSRPAREARARLTDEERRFRDLSEADFQRQVTDLAEVLGWTWCHWRALRNSRGIWQVPVEGPLGKGWPDLTLIRVRDRRLVFAELKREAQDPGPDQVAVLEVLGALDVALGRTPRPFELPPRVEVHVWRPSDLADPLADSVIGRILR
ncbi:MAG: hypothetical protein AB1627_01265 [Chloroflexota bacterium]